MVEILIVRDFTDVFSDEVPGLPPAREVEFTIDLVSHQFLEHLIIWPRLSSGCQGAVRGVVGSGVYHTEHLNLGCSFPLCYVEG